METQRAAPGADVGINVAATTLAVVRLTAPAPPAPAGTVANDASGWRELTAQLAAQGCRPTGVRLTFDTTGEFVIARTVARQSVTSWQFLPRDGQAPDFDHAIPSVCYALDG